MNAARGAQAYTQVNVETGVVNASPQRLVVMLYEGAIRAVAKARIAIQRDEVAIKCEGISKAMAIIQEGLQLSLDKQAGGEIAENLDALYNYMCERLLVANLKNDIKALDEVGRLLIDLKGAWEAIGQTPAAQAPAAPVQPSGQQIAAA